jgi:hypothetical protein
MAVRAVLSEPLSPLKFPANREFYREIWRYLLSFANGIARMLRDSLHLTRFSGLIQAQKNREFFRDNREFKFPVTLSSSENLHFPCDLVAKNASNWQYINGEFEALTLDFLD